MPCANAEERYEHYIPADKKLDPDWIRSLFAKGERKVYRGKELPYIAMPCGGIGAGELNIRGDGYLASWCIFNEIQAGGATGYRYLHPRVEDKRLEHGFAVRIKQAGVAPRVLRLNGDDFDDIRFIGEYPIATLDFCRAAGDLPVAVQGEVFSPFVPLSVRDSANPVTVLSYTVTNRSSGPLEISLAGWLENFALPGDRAICSPESNSGFRCPCLADRGPATGVRRNRVMRENGLTSVLLTVQAEGSGRHVHQGDMAVSVLDSRGTASAAWSSTGDFLEAFRGGTVPHAETQDYPLLSRPCGAVTSAPLRLAAGESATVRFLVSWYFPNHHNASPGCPGRVGHIYNNWYANAFEVAKHIAADFARLSGETHLFRDTYFDTTLPYWLVQRSGIPVSTLAADTVSIWENGRMYAFEGVSFCFGTCGHVYNFAVAPARLFPELERSVRLQQDLGPGFDPATGRVNFRGHDGANRTAAHAYASDAQCGYVLKMYREHLMSSDRSFLDRVWPHVKKIIGYLIFRDGACRGIEPNGVLEDLQTFWDPMWSGPNPYNNILYLAALRAAEEMARLKAEPALADRYHGLYESGRRFMNERMWNGEYYVHLYPAGFGMVNSDNGVTTLEQEDNDARSYIEAFNAGKPHYFVSSACDANQLFGQNWANQLGLGYILPPEHCRRAMESVFLYNWTPDISAVYDLYPPQTRTLAASGEGALVNGSWPRMKRLDFENTHDKDDIWCGLEYEAAANMINAGLLQEGLTVVRAIHDRYAAAKRNPWNEIEGWDHYSRSMHSWNVLLAVCGYLFDGPAGKIGFAPRLNPDNFRVFFSAAEGWGSLEQEIRGSTQSSVIAVKYGRLSLRTLVLEVPADKRVKLVEVTAGGSPTDCEFRQADRKVTVALSRRTTVERGGTFTVRLHW